MRATCGLDRKGPESQGCAVVDTAVLGCQGTGILTAGPMGGSHDITFCNLVLPDSSTHLPEVNAQPSPTVPFAVTLPPVLSVLTEASFSKGGGGLDGQELRAAVNL